MSEQSKTPEQLFAELVKDYADIFDTVKGKRVMADMEKAFFYNTTTAGEYVEHNEGMRTALLYIKDRIADGMRGPQQPAEPVMFEPNKEESDAPRG